MGQLRGEVLFGEGEAGGAGLAGMVPDRRDLARVVQQGPMCVGADLEVRTALALVHEVVHVAQQREAHPLVGRGECGDRPEVEHLVHRRGERDRGSGEGRDLRAPHTAGDEHELGLDLSAVGEHAAHPPGGDLDAGHLGLGDGGERARGPSPLAEELPGAQRIDDRTGGGVEAADQLPRLAMRDELVDLGGGEQMRLDAPGAGGAHPPGELLHPLGAAGRFDAAAAGEHAELAVLAQRVDGEIGDLLGMVDGEHEVRGVTGGAARIGQGTLVDLDDAAPAVVREMGDGGVAHHPGSDDDDVCTIRQLCHGDLPTCPWHPYGSRARGLCPEPRELLPRRAPPCSRSHTGRAATPKTPRS